MARWLGWVVERQGEGKRRKEEGSKGDSHDLSHSAIINEKDWPLYSKVASDVLYFFIALCPCVLYRACDSTVSSSC
jgi:hypothetical protein